jgi:hypothetical protein
MDNTVGSLTQTQRSIIIGTLLGDGYLRIVPGRRNAFLEINHAFSQREYVDWKYEMLNSVCKSGPISRKGNGTRIAYRFTTRQHSELTELQTLFYKNGVKRVPRNMALDPIMLAVWFMDDGSSCRASDVYLNTQQFVLEDQEYCLTLLSSLGIGASLNRDKEYWRIRIKKDSLPQFFSTIRKYIIPSMAYKLNHDPVETCS